MPRQRRRPADSVRAARAASTPPAGLSARTAAKSLREGRKYGPHNRFRSPAADSAARRCGREVSRRRAILPPTAVEHRPAMPATRRRASRSAPRLPPNRLPPNGFQAASRSGMRRHRVPRYCSDREARLNRLPERLFRDDAVARPDGGPESCGPRRDGGGLPPNRVLRRPRPAGVAPPWTPRDGDARSNRRSLWGRCPAGGRRETRDPGRPGVVARRGPGGRGWVLGGSGAGSGQGRSRGCCAPAISPSS